jgi:hypothetical protein
MALQPGESKAKTQGLRMPYSGCIPLQNIGIITTLILRQIKPVGTKVMPDKSGKSAVFYLFPDTEEVKDILESYYKHLILIEPKKFYEMTHLIRKEIFQIKNHIGGIYDRPEEDGNKPAESDNKKHDRKCN